VVALGCVALADRPRPADATGQVDQRGQPELRGLLPGGTVSPRVSQALLELLDARAAQARAVTAEDDPAVGAHQGPQALGQPTAEERGDVAQDTGGQGAEGLLPTQARLAGSAALGVAGDEEGAGGLEAFGLGVTQAPGHAQEHGQQRLQRPAPAGRAGPPESLRDDALDLPEQRRAEKIPQATDEPGLAAARPAAPRFLRHKSFLDRWFGWLPPSYRGTAFCLRLTGFVLHWFSALG